jgi:hypothetical protein
MRNYSTLHSTTRIPSIPSHITGGWIAKQPPERQLTALVAAAAHQTTIARHTLKQLAAMAGMSEYQFREVRRQHGAPIRSKKRRAPAALPAPVTPPVTASSASASPAKTTILPVPAASASASPAKPLTSQQIADLVATLRSFGSQTLLNAALVAEHDERQVARHLNGGAHTL